MKSSSNTKSVNVKCNRCGKTGTVTFYRVEKDGRAYWHIDSLPDYFNHDENSLGGAKIYCPCNSTEGPIYNPN